jgi:hypothetical protein
MRPVDNTRAALDRAYEHALDWPDGSRSATRMPSATAEQMLQLRRAVAEDPVDPAAVIDALAIAAEPGLVAPAGSFFGFVIGGTVPGRFGCGLVDRRLEAGNVNTGSCDPFRPAIQAATDRARAGGVPADSAGPIECGDRTRALHQRHHCEDPHHAHSDEAQSPGPYPGGRARVRDGTLRLPPNDHMGSVDRFRVARAVLLRRLNVYSTSMASPLPLPPFGGLHRALFSLSANHLPDLGGLERYQNVDLGSSRSSNTAASGSGCPSHIASDRVPLRGTPDDPGMSRFAGRSTSLAWLPHSPAFSSS